MHQTDQRTGTLDRGRLVRRANLERSESRMRADVPPKARVVVRQPGRRHPLDETLPLRVIAERRRRPMARQEAEHFGADREHPGVAPRNKANWRRERARTAARARSSP